MKTVEDKSRMLELLSKDSNYVSMENLVGILQWYNILEFEGEHDGR